MNKNSKGAALITGASSGFGLEFAQLFAADGYDLIITARPGSTLKKIADDLKKKYNINVWHHEIDLSKQHAAKNLYRWTANQNIKVSILVNNAGIGLYGKFTEHTLEQEQELINLNVNALSEMCYLYIPDMIKHGGGKILNIASIAGFQAGPYYATYFASKGYVLLFSEALYYEYAGDNIHVTTLCPGVAQTGFFKRANMREDSLLLQSYFMSAKRVAKAGYRGLMSGKSIVVPGNRNKFVSFGYRILPRKVINRITKKVILSAAETHTLL